MGTPISNGLIEIAGTKVNERGFCCWKLICFLTDGGVKDWDAWHNAHLLAAAGKCQFKKRCPVYAKRNKQPIQLELF